MFSRRVAFGLRLVLACKRVGGVLRVPRYKTLGFAAIFLAILAVAAAFRLPGLGIRPMHGDEANQAVKAGILFDKGVYRYDPYEHHGPTLYYLTIPFLWLSGAQSFAETTEIPYRLVPVLFSLGLILLLWPLRKDLGSGAALWAALFAAISPAMVFYSRYYIQEALLVFFSVAAIVCGWRYGRNRRNIDAALAGLCLGLMHATKETCVVIYACMAAALAATLLLAYWREGRIPEWCDYLRPWAMIACIASGAGVSVMLFSSFLTHARGPLDSILAFGTYLHRAEGAGTAAIHDKPWPYYLKLLMYTYRTAGPRWSEGLILGLAAIGAAVSLLRKDDRPDSGSGLRRFFAFYTLLLAAAFSLIPYKTPWNVLVFMQGMTVLAGIGAMAVIRAGPKWPIQTALAAALALGTAQLGHQAWLANFRYPADARNPYVYAHTSTALLRLVNRIEDIAKLAPEGRHLRIDVLKPDADYWPLPWYLRRYDRVGYWAQLPERFEAPFIIADPRLHERLETELGDRYQEEIYALRPSVLLNVYIRKDLWDALIQSRS